MSAAYPVVVERSLAGSIARGVLAALVGGLLLATGLTIAIPNSGAEFFAAGIVLAAPVLAIFGALGGIVIHYLRGPISTARARSWTDAAGPSTAPPIWLRVAGGAAGLQLAGLSTVVLSGLTAMVSLVLAPLWIMAGVAITWRVHRSTGSTRALGVGVVVGTAVHSVGGMLLWGIGELLSINPAGWLAIRDLLVVSMAAGAGLLAYNRARRATLG